MTAPRFTVDVIKQALEHENSAMAALLMMRLLIRLRDALQSGEVAILTKADREAALDAERAGTVSACATYRSDGRTYQAKARTLLQLPVEDKLRTSHQVKGDS